MYNSVDDGGKPFGSQLTLDDLFQRSFQIHDPDAKWISGKYSQRLEFLSNTATFMFNKFLSEESYALFVSLPVCHFVVTCTAKDCPPLSQDVYVILRFTYVIKGMGLNHTSFYSNTVLLI